MYRIKKNFGFGCMRLPMSGDEVDKVQMCQMVDAFLEAGFNYFDTAHGYLQGKSETALRDCLTSRYPRDRYVLTDKLTGSYFKTEEDIHPEAPMRIPDGYRYVSPEENLESICKSMLADTCSPSL